MSNTFNFNRFSKYYISDLSRVFSDNYLRVLLMSLAGVIAYFFCGIIHLIFSGDWISYSLAGRFVTFFIIFCVLIMVVPSKEYGILTDKHQGILFTLLPASAFEKFLAMFINVVILTPLAYFGISLTADALMCLTDPNCGQTLASAIFGTSQEYKAFMIEAGSEASLIPGHGELVWAITLNIINMTLIFLVGALYFKKNKVSKTILYYILFLMVLSIIVSLLFSHFNGFENWLNNFDGDIERVSTAIKASGFIISGLFTIGMSLWTYFRIKTIKY